MDDFVPAFLTQLLPQSPLLLAYFTGFILAIVFWRRSVRACVLTLIGSAGLFVTTILRIFGFQYVAMFSNDWGWDRQQIESAFRLQAIAGNILEAVFFALILGAVFAAMRHSTTPAAAGSTSDVRETSIWSFRGRIGRAAFLSRFFLLLFANVAVAVLLRVGMMNSDMERDTPALVGIIAINLLVVIIGGWLSFAMQVKRWHDLDKSGWLLLLNFTLIAIPVVVIILMCVRGTPGPNRFGSDPLSTNRMT